ncbi:protein-S-isoprenylcysteine O-methyltransferase B-like isoform X2 [Magnolia sinica]|uniref:protein-S-isoprenylcysteine O-methyltransferase B-like isoform X2 n=1 Tax=Magnolia sinica TaxID=86752 RepID=UPI00265B60D0|nr:protein-S-isoprenylcysteine O-methyltransferase B-like isoform X2 [Magnolia sinica]
MPFEFESSQILKPNPRFSIFSENPNIAPGIRAEEVQALSRSKMADFFGYTSYRQLGQLFAAVAFFHGSEYALAVAIHGRFRVSLSSLLISKHYLLAMAFALLEYVLEIFLFPGMKELWWISNIGLMMVVVGEVIRKTAILTARRAFTHKIKIYHEEHHELVTDGIYRYEEFFLREFFGSEYDEYAQRVPSGIPFVK